MEAEQRGKKQGKIKDFHILESRFLRKPNIQVRTPKLLFPDGRRLRSESRVMLLWKSCLEL